TEETFEKIIQFAPKLVAIYSGRLSQNSDIEFANMLESKSIQTVFVGPYASIDPKKLLLTAGKNKLVIEQEFELPLAELISGTRIEEIKNLWYYTNNEIHHNENRPLYDQNILDTFPPTSPYIHKQLNIKSYRVPSESYPFIDVMSGRGCAWGKCNFCLWVQTFVPGSGYRTRSIDHFMQEFEYIVSQLPYIKTVMIQDDMLTNNRAREIAEALLKRNIKINWSCYAKPNSKLTLDTLKLMKKSGCVNLHVGFESGNDEILKKIDKGSTAQQAIEFADLVHEAKLNIHGDFAMGHFGETKETAEQTIALAKRINPHSAQFQIMIPFEKTKFWNQLESTNSLNKNGEPDYSRDGGLSAEQIRLYAKSAYKKFYLSGSFLKKVLLHPWEHFLSRLDQYFRAIPAIFWKRWEK
ncbi:MAG: radical SAM protein, partial [Oligoflexia bacterium]|nr:radical SAM protein [Oligoflexia bacterium]